MEAENLQAPVNIGTEPCKLNKCKHLYITYSRPGTIRTLSENTFYVFIHWILIGALQDTQYFYPWFANE